MLSLHALRRLPATIPRLAASKPTSTSTSASLSTLRIVSRIPPTAFISRLPAAIPATMTTGAVVRPTVQSAGTALSAVAQVRGMKVRSAVKKMCTGCKSVRRKGYLYIICSKNQKHKQRQG